ncbi:MBL fold metallo-hydrolase [Paenibacillus spiritus]|uniref:MBL fold metallo-hydrolase n=1 Tax=Paenibacillus spiritus TaxID=2496557 RepID=A0A5J5GK26_9BACL|nr:MBL fold metallo-hydrolase [Paenibacillus spiritus]KAA9008656.1 MBL fold metallo-hydrolase [Paenibacillus spiritus]
MRTGQELQEEIRRTEVPHGCLAVWFLGQESVVAKGDGLTIYIDPYVSEDPDRTFPPPLEAERVTDADLVLITHEHSDHLDRKAIPVIARNNPEARFLAPSCCRKELLELGVNPDRLEAAVPDAWAGYGPKLRIHPLAAAHESLEYSEDGLPRYVGYILELNGVTLYHAGDTVLFPELVEKVGAHRIDLAMLPINGRDYFRNSRDIVGNMNYREAAEFAAVSGFDTMVPLHYDLYAGNAENPGYFVDYMYKHYPENKLHVMARGERFVYVSPGAF